MRAFRSASLAEQVAAHLRREIGRGALGPKLPGVHRLAAELGVHHTTAEEALQILLREGVLIAQGAGRRRLVREGVLPERANLRIGILTYEELDRTQHYLLEVRHWLQDAGHAVEYAERSMLEMRMDVGRVARHVSGLDYDAWLVVAGSREVLRWFAGQSKPAFGIFGRRRGVDIAGVGPDKLPAALEAVDRLVALGHQKIVVLLREEHRLPQLGLFAQSMLDRMEAHGLPTGVFNLPGWENHPADFRRCLDSLFRFTPPTAMIVDEVMLFHAAQQHLACKGIVAPRHVSLVCNDHDRSFVWSSPSITHIRWDNRELVRRVAEWADHVGQGKEYRRQSAIQAEFVDGGTIGPAP